MTITIYHNPECGTSRNVLAVLQAAGYEPEIIEYLLTGWQRDQLISLFAAAGLTPRTALRETKSPAKELGLLDPSVSHETLLDAMLEHPVLVNRPIVVTDKGTKLCRPSETVLDLIDRYPPGPFYKEDGALMIDTEGLRVG
ncbi:arsenate reductase (glutaredoxin) [Asticcacaulis sp. AC402]|uniref:arsenate reductase (glutaredoxin) n=1 Tax=Asticcacaulis sp. AC402 TaxID=1282361 RepID=UPI0003C3B7E1|nr:arsenate reductase (glutaredoxin) [Asticcacaulis sp. AC402]ESQ73521.1 arsenate reductase [Asticcacaulis sp. AC402]